MRHRLDERGLTNVGYVSNPEFTAEGTAVRDFQQPDRIVIGAFDEADGDAVAELHGGIDGPIVRCDVASAEMIKLAANAALMTRISFINEIANVCEATGADVVRVAEGIGLDRRIGPSFLRAGIGYGGSCFPKDSLALKQLAANSGYHFQLLNSVIEVNELQKRRVIGKLQQQLGTLRGKTVALLGLAFKPGTDDTREAPSLVLAGRLIAEGAEVRAWDPVVDGNGVLPQATIHADPLEALDGRGRSGARDRVGAARAARLGRRRAADAPPVPRRRAQHARSRRDAGGRLRLRGDRPGRGRLAMEALILAGGKAERLGEAAQGKPKPLVPVAGRPLVAHTIDRLAAAGVTRAIVACAVGQEAQFDDRPRRAGRRDRRRSASPSRSAAAAGSVSPPATGARREPCWR